LTFPFSVTWARNSAHGGPSGKWTHTGKYLDAFPVKSRRGFTVRVKHIRLLDLREIAASLERRLLLDDNGSGMNEVNVACSAPCGGLSYEASERGRGSCRCGGPRITVTLDDVF